MTSGGVDDLIELSEFDETILLKEIKSRYENEKIYTYIGDILIAVNPYRNLDLYGAEKWKTYSAVKVRRLLPPHLYAISDCVYQNLRINCVSQCCIVSGESGAGKTESTKLLIEHIIQLCRHSSKNLDKRIIQVNPLLEAFGNAQTVINSNSSRFGKFIELNLDSGGQILGASISEYLLEKSRVVSHGKGERSFHIFYYLFAGLSKDQKEANLLSSPDDHRILKQFADERVFEDEKTLTHCRNKWNELIELMKNVGFFDLEIEGTLAVLAAILHIADIKFIPDPESDGVLIQNEAILSLIGVLISVSPEELVKALISNTSSVGSEKVTSLKNESQASDGRDALAKALYSHLFSWMVSKINQLLQSDTQSSSCLKIGVLDIYGFEDLKMNSFEQLCINIANEQLQSFFNQSIFQAELEEYKREGIVINHHIQYIDNRPLMEMLIGRAGLFAIVDEESRFPKGTDRSLIAKLSDTLKNNPEFKPVLKQGLEFTIQHFAGTVTYNVSGFLEKNRDTLSNSMMHCLKTSTSFLVIEIFKNVLQEQSNKLRKGVMARNARMSVLLKGPLSHQLVVNSAKLKKNLNPDNSLRGSSSPTDGLPQVTKTLASQFKNSLDGLLQKLRAAEPHFIRCIKPNAVKEPKNFDSRIVLQQLNYTGVLETVKIRRLGFPTRLLFKDFIRRYEIISSLASSEPIDNPSESCKRLLEKSGLKNWQIGKTKVFLRQWQLERLNFMVAEVRRKIVDCQRFSRAALAKRTLRRLQKDALAGCSYHCQRLGNTVLAVTEKAYHLQKESQKMDHNENLIRSSGLKNISGRNKSKTVERPSKSNNSRSSSARPTGFGTLEKNTANNLVQYLYEDTLDRVSGLTTDIWAKIYYMEKNCISVKLYLRDWEVVLNDSIDEYDGTTIGINCSSYDHLTDDPECLEITKSVGKGVKISRDEDGNIYLTRLSECDVIVKGHVAPDRTALSREIVELRGKLGSEEIKVFDVLMFKQRMLEALRSADWDPNRLAMKAVISFCFVRDSARDEDTVCWACIVNFAAFDLLGKRDVFEEFEREGQIPGNIDDLWAKWTSIDFHRMVEGYRLGDPRSPTRM